MIRFSAQLISLVTLIVLAFQACNPPAPKNGFPISVGKHVLSVSPHPDSISTGYLHLRVFFEETPVPVSIHLNSNDGSTDAAPTLSLSFQDSMHLHSILEPETSYTIVIGQEAQSEIELLTPPSPMTQTQAMNGIIYKAAIEQNFKAVYGIHPIRFFLLHKNEKAEGKAEWKPLTNAELFMIPWMEMSPGKGHGSSFNEPPKPTTVDGVYEGKVSFSMPGKWDIRLKMVSPLSSDTLTFLFPVAVQPAR